MVSTAAKMGSHFNTMPSAPPKGRSSTVRWRSCVQSRKLWMRMSRMPVSLARLTTPWANGPSKNSGKIVSTWKITSGSSPQSFRQFYGDALFGGFDLHADGAGEGNQQIAGDEQARPAAIVPPGHGAQQFPGAVVYDLAADEVRFKVFAL